MNPIKADRISFSSVKHPLDYNDFLEVQLKSFKELFQLGSTPEQRKDEALFRVAPTLHVTPFRSVLSRVCPIRSR